ncbi:alpha/beta hydrolase [Halobellus captivus]|uniref:alpha/beta hydrolase n=1 Tax=Halobellus captivus TaxID=2592614 RepID=UPI001EF01766|nr:alpha/beta fold hydrolase [Halobellus captivus]
MTIRRPEHDDSSDQSTVERGPRPEARRKRPSRDDFSTVTLTFRSGGERCVGRLYRPDRPADPALIVLGGGPIGAEGAGLDRFAERLAAAGCAVFHFDERTTGDSDGEPRNHLSPTRQRADWEAALAGLRGRSDVATDRVILWGIDLAGGTVLDVAADDPRVSAVVAQTPILDGRAFLRQRGAGFLAKGILSGVCDVIQSRLRGPHTVPIADESGESGGSALVSTPSAHRAYRDLVDDDWENRTPARSLLALARHTAGDDRDRLACPVLFVGGTRDDVVPIESIEAASESLANATLVRLPAGHFDLYDGRGFEQAIGHGLAFVDAAVSE